MNQRSLQSASGILLAMVCVAAAAQGGPGGSGGGSGNGTASSSPVNSVLQVQQQLSQPGPSVTPSAGSNDPSYRGSIVRDKATAGVMQLSLDDAMQ